MRITPDYPLDLPNVMKMIVNRAAFIKELTELQQAVAQLLAQLQASEAKKLVRHLYQARKQYRLLCERPNKGNTAIEREITSSYQVAQSLGFKGDFRAWEHLLRTYEGELDSNDQQDRSSVCRTGGEFLDEAGDSPDVNSRLPVNRDFFGADALEKRK
jgi:hypothetical protein